MATDLLYLEDQADVLIPGLPDDIGKLCLALVPRSEFPAMTGVSKAWKSFLQSQEFYRSRKTAGTLEEWLYALVRDPKTQIDQWQVLGTDCSLWKSLPRMPGPFRSQYGFVVIDGKLLVMGGLRKVAGNSEVLSEVLMYDSASNRWSKVASMHGARYEFASAVMGGRVYVIGGHGKDGENLSTVEVYDVQKDEWNSITSLKRARWGCIACGIDGKIYVMGGRSSLTIGSSRCISVYDSATKQWNDMKAGCATILTHAVLDKKIYCIEWKNERKLMVYDPVEGTWADVPIPMTGSVDVGFCLGSFDGKIVLFPRRQDAPCKTLLYDPSNTTGVGEWKTSAIRPLGSCIFCASIAT